jgi:hypothetical protein
LFIVRFLVPTPVGQADNHDGLRVMCDLGVWAVTMVPPGGSATPTSKSMSWPSPGAWESDEELDEVLIDLYASRRANVA